MRTNITGLRKILKQLEKKHAKRLVLYSISTSYIDTRMSLPGSKLQFLRNPENLSEISRIFEKSSKLLDGLLLRQSFRIQSGSSLAVHEKNQILRLITAEIQRGIA